MSYIARTDGGQSVLEVREGVLTDITEADRANWLNVTENRPNIDNLTQVLSTFTYSVQNGYVSMDWQVTTPPELFNKDKLKKYAALRSWQKRVGGLTLPNGIRIDTSSESQNNIIGAVESIERGMLQEPLQFCALSGPVTASLNDLKAIWEAIAVYSQASWSARAACFAAIDAGTITNAAQVDAAI